MNKKRFSPQLTPLATKVGVEPLFGDIHNHCNISYGHGSLTDALKRAKRQLDFVSVTGHAHWPDMPVDDPSVAHIVAFHVEGFAKLKKNWLPHYETLKQFDEPGQFTAMPGYEIHSAAFGDLTIVYKELDEPQPLQLADSPAELKQKLHHDHKGNALAFPHHIGYRVGARGINWQSFDEELSPFVEMFSMHGCAEQCNTDKPYLHTMGPIDYESTMAYGLAHGKRFGVVGNTDHHSAYPGSYGDGRMSVYVASHNRDQLWHGLKQTHTNALTGANIHLLAAVAGETEGAWFIQGSTLQANGNTRLHIETLAGGAIDYLDIVKNGRLFKRITPELSPAPISSNHTLLALELGWGARGQVHRWEGNLTVTGGQLEAVEPRFRGGQIVSPLHKKNAANDDDSIDDTEISMTDNRVEFAVSAIGNPNHRTQTSQGFMAQLTVTDQTQFSLDLNGHQIEVTAERLFQGSKSGNLGPIDSPAYRILAMPKPESWQWQGQIDLGPTQAGDTVYLRLRQQDGQMAWTSPFFITD